MPLPNGMLIDDEDPRFQDVQIEELEDCQILGWKDQNGVQCERRVPARHTMTFRPQVSTYKRPRKSRRQLAEEAAAAEAERIQSQNQGAVQPDTMEAAVEPQELGERENETAKGQNDNEEQKISQWPEDRVGIPRFKGTLEDWENFYKIAADRDWEQEAKLEPVNPKLAAAFRSQPDHPSKTGLVIPDTQKKISNSPNDDEKSMDSAEETRLVEAETLE